MGEIMILNFLLLHFLYRSSLNIKGLLRFKLDAFYDFDHDNFHFFPSLDFLEGCLNKLLKN